jgi:hypothetical protein
MLNPSTNVVFTRFFPPDGPVAQRLEQWTHNPLVPGSNPGGPTNEFTSFALLTYGSKSLCKVFFNLAGIGFTAGRISAILSRT